MEEILFRRPELEDREKIQRYFDKYPSRNCERTFVNAYLWSRHYGVTFAIVENTLVFKMEHYGCSFTYPLGEESDVKRALEILMQYAREKGVEFRLHNVSASQYEKLDGLYPGKYEIEYHRDVADYVYETEKLASLSGKKLSPKRNHINKFKSTYENWSYESMSKENLEECFQMALEWRNENGCDEDHDKNSEMCVTLNALRLFEELHLTGGVLKIDGKVIAFTIGEPVCKDTFVVHIEKAFADIQGAYPMINQQFVQHECMEYSYINREDDAGSEGLRKAKLSYRPIFLIEKGTVKEKEK